MFRKSFPLKAEILFGKNVLTICLESIWGGPVTIDLSGKKGIVKKCEIASIDKPYAEFYGLSTGSNYNVKIRFTSLFRRIKYRPFNKDIYLNGQTRLRVQGVGTGRSGTTSLAIWLDGLTFNDGQVVVSRHETLSRRILALIIEKQFDKVEYIIRAFSHNVEIAPYFLFAPQSIIGERVFLLVRDGREVVTSGMVRGWYTRDSIWDKVKFDFPGNAFEKSCQLWAKSCEVLVPKADILVRLEDLINSQNERYSFLRMLDIQKSNKPLPHKNISKNPSTGFEWTNKEHEIFEKYCSTHMDNFYPGWRKKVI